MAERKKKNVCRSHCPISVGLDIFGDKWSLLVIRDLMFLGKRTYSEILDSEEGIATNILADRLARLSSEGIVSKSRDPKNRRRYIYRLTRKGVALLPILLEIVAWSARYDPETAAPPPFVRKIRSDRDSLIREIAAGLGYGRRRRKSQ